MGISKKVSFLLVSALLFVLAACGGQQAGMRQNDFSQSFSGYTSDVGEVIAGVQQDLALQALGNKPSGAPDPLSNSAAALAALSAQSLTGSLSTGTLLSRLAPLSNGALTVGRWVYNPGNSDWDEDTNYSGDDLVLDWDFQDENGQDHTAELVADWNYQGHDTVDATNMDGSTVELPTDVRISLKVDGSEAGYLRGQFAWYAGSCGTIAEPTSATIDGRFGVNDRLELNNIVLTISDSQVAFSGEVKAVTSSDSASFSWNLTANGHNVRGADCFSERFDTTSGSINLRSNSTTGGQSESAEFNTNFSVHYDGNQPTSLDLSGGYVKLNGQTAATFQGTLDDSNNNGVPGENVIVTFADGQTTLEDLIMNGSQ